MEKPDFDKLAADIYYKNHELDTDTILIIAMEHVWNTHVVPLQETLKEIDAFIDTCNDEYKREYADLELKVRRQSDHIEVLKTENKALREEIEILKDQIIEHGELNGN